MPKPENVIGKGVKFTADNQPTPEAKSKGMVEWWHRRKLAENMLAEFSKPFMLIDDVEIEQCPHETAIELIKRALVDEKIPAKDRIELYLKFCNHVGVEKKDIKPDPEPEPGSSFDASKLSDSALAEIMAARSV